MQTFLPHASFKKSLACLDYRRLGKQRTEAFQLLIAIGDQWALKERQWRIDQGLMKDKPLKGGWINHPAALMWKRYADALRQYYNDSIDEWTERGYNNTMRKAPIPACVEMPRWLTDRHFHASHRSNLLRKDSEYYSQFGWTEPDNLEYVWPNA
jgi:hypothetical protein